MTSWEDKVDYNNYVAEVGKRFAEEHPDLCSGVDVLPVSYSGYEAKFQTATLLRNLMSATFSRASRRPIMRLLTRCLKPLQHGSMKMWSII